MTEYGLGRVPRFDERSRDYPIRQLVEPLPVTEPTRKVWRRPLAIDQGNTSSCTGHDAWGRLNTQKLTSLIPYDTRRKYTPFQIYDGAKTADEWPGEDYDGSSVLGAAQWLKSAGIIQEYRWAFGAPEVIGTLRKFGAVGLGTTWYNSMFDAPDPDPGRKGVPLKVDPNSGLAGGHAYEAHGDIPDKQLIVCTNSWGPEWGDEGRFYLSYSDLDLLLADRGEAIVYVG